MKIQNQVAVLFIISVLASNTLFSQTKDFRQPLPLVKYMPNVDAPLTVKELAQIKEVYGDYAEKEVLNRPQRVKDIKNILRNRVEIFDTGEKDLSSLPKLSKVEMFDDYVPSISRDYNFNPNIFNPLKYKFNFYSRNSSTYHVDGTGYYITIKSQHQQF